MQPRELPSLSNEGGGGQVPETQQVTAGGGCVQDTTPVTGDAEIPCLKQLSWGIITCIQK